MALFFTSIALVVKRSFAGNSLHKLISWTTYQKKLQPDRNGVAANGQSLKLVAKSLLSLRITIRSSLEHFEQNKSSGKLVLFILAKIQIACI